MIALRSNAATEAVGYVLSRAASQPYRHDPEEMVIKLSEVAGVWLWSTAPAVDGIGRRAVVGKG